MVDRIILAALVAAVVWALPGDGARAHDQTLLSDDELRSPEMAIPPDLRERLIMQTQRTPSFLDFLYAVSLRQITPEAAMQFLESEEGAALLQGLESIGDIGEIIDTVSKNREVPQAVIDAIKAAIKAALEDGSGQAQVGGIQCEGRTPTTVSFPLYHDHLFTGLTRKSKAYADRKAAEWANKGKNVQKAVEELDKQKKLWCAQRDKCATNCAELCGFSGPLKINSWGKPYRNTLGLAYVRRHAIYSRDLLWTCSPR